jgi:hypothetical protein
MLFNAFGIHATAKCGNTLLSSVIGHDDKSRC